MLLMKFLLLLMQTIYLVLIQITVTTIKGSLFGFSRKESMGFWSISNWNFKPLPITGKQMNSWLS